MLFEIPICINTKFQFSIDNDKNIEKLLQSRTLA